MFYPIKLIPRKLAASIWGQMKKKVFKGDIKALVGMILASFDLIINFTNRNKGKCRLTNDEFRAYNSLEETKIYWQVES